MTDIVQRLIASSCHENCMMSQAAKEIVRLRKCLKWQQDRDITVSTHSEGCYEWGNRHYECALREISSLREQLAALKTDQEPVGYAHYEKGRLVLLCRNDACMDMFPLYTHPAPVVSSEPVAYYCSDCSTLAFNPAKGYSWEPLYLHPAPKALARTAKEEV